MLPCLKSFFVAQDKPQVLKRLFEDTFSEIRLWHLQSLVSVFCSHTGQIERETVGGTENPPIQKQCPGGKKSQFHILRYERYIAAGTEGRASCRMQSLRMRRAEVA
jgi:hypothetical protein